MCEDRKTAVWNEKQWEREFQTLMEIARGKLNPNWEYGEVVVLKTVKGNIYAAQIPNYQDTALREPLENQCIQKMRAENDTEVFSCLATVNGKVPEILSWNFRSRLIEEKQSNLKAMCFLWGGGENVRLRAFHELLPPNYTTKKGT